MRPPTDRQIPTVVCVRVAVPSSTGRGDEPTYTNTLYRASVQAMGAAARTLYGLQGSIRAARLLFGHDPGVQADDLILVPPVRTGDPADPAPGDLWVDAGSGTVRRFDGAAATTLATVAGLSAAPLEIAGPDPDDLGGGDVLVALGPAEDSAQLGIQYRVDATEPQ